MRVLRFGLAAACAVATLGAAATALADDPADMVAQAKRTAQAAPDALTRRSLALVALPTYGTAKFRGVKALYIRQELINDQVMFCGEIDAVIPATKVRSGFTRFIYIPGDPTTFFTETEGLGNHEIGKQIVHQFCDAKDVHWMSADYTADFSRMPKTLAEADKSGGGAE